MDIDLASGQVSLRIDTGWFGLEAIREVAEDLSREAECVIPEREWERLTVTLKPREKDQDPEELGRLFNTQLVRRATLLGAEVEKTESSPLSRLMEEVRRANAVETDNQRDALERDLAALEWELSDDPLGVSDLWKGDDDGQETREGSP